MPPSRSPKSEKSSHFRGVSPEHRAQPYGWGGNPTVKAWTSDRLLEVSIFHECDSKPNYSYCGSAPAAFGPFSTAGGGPGAGCQGDGGAVVETDCSGSDESGRAYVRVRQKISDGTCHSYTLDVTVE